MVKKAFKMDKVVAISLIIVLVLIAGILIFSGVTYSYWLKEQIAQKTNEIQSGCFSFSLSDENNISLNNTYPMSETEALKNTPYTFTITNTCSIDMAYNVTLNTTGSSDLDSYLNYKIISDSKSIGPKILSTAPIYNEYNNNTYTDDSGDFNIINSYILTNGNLASATMNTDNTQIVTPGESITYKLYLWIDENVEDPSTMGKTFEAKILITSSTSASNIAYKEDILNGADPVLKSNLIPVNIADDGTVTKANIKNEWYKYENKKWANAVILEDSSITYNDNDVIPESNIESYFVWIPRYKYKIFNLGNYDSVTSVDENINKTIDIVFENKYTTPSDGTTVGSYLTHPAFRAFNTNGLWVGKFETTGTSSSITVRPGETSLRNLNVKTMFNLAYNYNRNLESHMMKNTEWGAVTYLTYSKYGKNSRVRINNHSSYKTGYAAVNEPTCGWTATNETCNKYGTDSSITVEYNTTTGYLASTTGNITGIYDMAGGAHEYMASYTSGQVGSSGFTKEEIIAKIKYFDVYNASSSQKSYNYRILGDATGELGPFGTLTSTGSNGDKISNINSFYSGSPSFVDSSYPWFTRGASFVSGVLTGPSCFNRSKGEPGDHISFRLVLS